jgi:hypothetical protein
MAASSSGKTTPKLLFTLKQRRQLMKLLQDAAPHRNHDKALERMDRSGAKFINRLQSVGFRPMTELWERVISSKAYERRFETRAEKLSPAGHRRQLFGIGKAEDLLRAFVTDVGRCWKETTGHPLPKLAPEVLDRCGVGYWPELTVIAASHPLWLIIDAVQVKVGAWAVNHLVCYARREAGEKISVPALFWPVSPVKPKRLH